LVGRADQPLPKISFFRRLRQASSCGFCKPSDFEKALPVEVWLSQSRGLGYWWAALPPTNTPRISFFFASGRESDACIAGLSDFEKAQPVEAEQLPNNLSVG
jgi:hypothetical protein